MPLIEIRARPQSAAVDVDRVLRRVTRDVAAALGARRTPSGFGLAADNVFVTVQPVWSSGSGAEPTPSSSSRTITAFASTTSRPSDSAVIRSRVRTLVVPTPSSSTITRTAPSSKRS